MEVLLAMAVMIFAVSAAVLMCFGGQFFTADAAQNSEALDLAQRMLWCQRDLALNDFRLVNATSTQEGIFNAKVEVSPHSFFVKKVNASVDFNIGNRPQKVELETLIADYNNTAGNDTCDSNLTGDWKNPQIKKVIDFSKFAEVDWDKISDLDAYKGKLYISINDTATSTDPVFFILDIIDLENPLLLQKGGANIKKSNSLTVNDAFIYLAGKSSVNQLQIANNNGLLIASLELGNINNGDCEKSATAIFHKNNYIYLGLERDNNCSEFNIIDVGDINNPSLISGFEIGAKVNDVYIKGDYAYLATADSARELIILNIADPLAPTLVASYDLLPDQTNWGYGKSVQIIGNRIYLGRTYIANSPEFYLLNHGQSSIDMLGNYSEDGDPFSVNDLLVRDDLAFVLAGSASQGGSLRILDIFNPTNAVEQKMVGLPGQAGGIGGVALDCEGNYLYVASIDGAGKSYISIITAQ